MKLNDIGDLLGNAIDEDLDYYLYETLDGNVVVQVRFELERF